MRSKGINFSGIVLRGEGIGRTLDAPTLNLDPAVVSAELEEGIYAVRVKTEGGDFGGVAYYGKRHFHRAPLSFEVHCFGLKKELYDTRAIIEVVSKLREVKRFRTESALKKQIGLDITAAQKIV